MQSIGPDGIAFVIQFSDAGLTASGSAGAGLGYGAALGNPSGIEKSVAVEFDSWFNPELKDPAYFHIGVHSNGGLANNASEEYLQPTPPTSTLSISPCPPHSLTAKAIG